MQISYVFILFVSLMVILKVQPYPTSESAHTLKSDYERHEKKIHKNIENTTKFTDPEKNIKLVLDAFIDEIQNTVRNDSTPPFQALENVMNNFGKTLMKLR